MKLYKLILILIIFLKTETLLSDNNLFSVNNILIEKNDKNTNMELSNKAIKKGFNQLISKILLKQDIEKLKNLNFSIIKELVIYYQISDNADEDKNKEFLNFNVTFDKDKIHNLFYKSGILYSEITDKEIFILPILIQNNEIFVFNKNFFYKNWNSVDSDDLIEFILPLENIEVIQNINKTKNSLIDLNIDILFKEYPDKNLALILINDNKDNNKKIFLKAKIQDKIISKNFNIKKEDLGEKKLNEKIILETKKELINLVKLENLIDIRTPSFLNVKLNLNKKTSLVEFNSRSQNIDVIENIYIQDFNKDYINLRIKYLGKFDKMLNQLKKNNINLQLINDSWIIKSL